MGKKKRDLEWYIRRWDQLKERAAIEEMPIPEGLSARERVARGLATIAQRKRRPQRFLDQAICRYRIICGQLEELVATLEMLDVMGDEFEKIPYQQDILNDQRKIEVEFEECFSLLCGGDLEGVRQKMRLIKKGIDGISTRYARGLMIA